MLKPNKSTTSADIRRYKTPLRLTGGAVAFFEFDVSQMEDTGHDPVQILGVFPRDAHLLHGGRDAAEVLVVVQHRVVEAAAFLVLERKRCEEEEEEGVYLVLI